MVPAVVFTATITILMTDLGRALSTAVATAGFVALVTMSSTTVRSSTRPTRAAIGAAAGIIASVGAAGVGAGSTSAVAAQFALVWFVTMLVTGRFLRFRSDAPTDFEASRSFQYDRLLLPGAATVGLSCALASAFDGFDRSATIIAFAVPLALCIFRASTGDLPSRSSQLVPTTRAALAGFAGVIGAALTLPGQVPSSALPVLAGIAIAIAALIALSTPEQIVGHVLRPVHSTGWLTPAALLLVIGAGGTGVTFLALAIAVAAAVASRSRRSASLHTPTPSAPPDPSPSSSRRIVAGLTLIGFAVRTFTHRGLWLDETTSVFQAKKPLVDMVQFIGETDNHPPLHHIVLWADIRLVGDSEFALRLPMMLMGAALIPMVYLIGREFFDRRIGLYAAAFATVAPVAVWYGQEARMYSQFMLLAAISTYGLARILKSGQRRYWVIFTLANVALVYTQYFGVLHVVATVVVLAIEVYRRRHTPGMHALLRGEMGSIVAHAVLLAPLVPFALAQAMRNQDEGFGFSTTGITAGSDVVPPPGLDGFLTNLQWIFLGYQPDDVSIRLVALWPIGLLVLLLLLGTPRRTSNRILLTLAGIPMLAVFGASFIAAQSRSLAEVRYFAGAVPIFLVLLAAGVGTVARSRRLQRVAVGSIVAVMSGALVVQQFDTDNPRLYQYEEAVEQIRDDARPGDSVVFAPQYFNYTLDYYEPTIPSAPLEDGVPTAGANSVFIIEADSFADSDDARNLVDAALTEFVDQGRSVDARYTFAQVTVWKIGPAA